MSKYSPITEFLKNQPAEKRDLTVSFDTLEEILGFSLPKSALTHRPWCANDKAGILTQAWSWLEAGLRVDSVNFAKLWVRFKRESGFRPEQTSNEAIPAITDIIKKVEEIPHSGFYRDPSDGSGKRIVLVSCVKSKSTISMPAKDLYISDLFKKSSAYAKLIGDSWYILSAKYGLLSPDQVIEPYEKTLNKMGVEERKSWAKNVMSDLAKIVTPGDEVVFLAGVKYRKNLIQPLKKMGSKISVPMEGLSFGNQLKWLKNKLG
jgi:hypothetical protein